MRDLTIRYLIHHEYMNGSSSRLAADKINRTLGKDSVTDRTVRHWYQRFRNGDMSLEDRPRSGRPSSFDEDALLRELEKNPDASLRSLENVLGWDHSTIARHMQALKMRNELPWQQSDGSSDNGKAQRRRARKKIRTASKGRPKKANRRVWRLCPRRASKK